MQTCRYEGMQESKYSGMQVQEYKFESMHYTHIHLWTYVSIQISMFVFKQKYICKYECMHV